MYNKNIINSLFVALSLLIYTNAFAATASVKISGISIHDYDYNTYIGHLDPTGVIKLPMGTDRLSVSAKITMLTDNFPSHGKYPVSTNVVDASFVNYNNPFPCSTVYLAPNYGNRTSFYSFQSYNANNLWYDIKELVVPYQNYASIGTPVFIYYNLPYSKLYVSKTTVQEIKFEIYDSIFGSCYPSPIYRDSLMGVGDKIGEASVQIQFDNCYDRDGDGYYPARYGCTTKPYDCNDFNKDISPGVEEICGDSIDNNCDGIVDDNCCPTITDFSASGQIDATGTSHLSFGYHVDGSYDSAIITINGHQISGSSWQGKLGSLVHEGGNPVTLTVRKAGCPDATSSRLVIIVKDTENCGYKVSLGSKGNLASGELSESLDLFATTGTGLPLGLKLAYLSQDGNDGPLGLNWTHNFNISLVEDDAGTVALRNGSGQWALYTPVGAGYASQPGDTATLTKAADGTFVLASKDGTRYVFGSNNRISTITDRNGNALNFAYTSNDLASVTDNAGRTVTFDYANGKLTSITDPAGAVYRFAVGTSLDRITLPDGSAWQFGYQNSAFLTAKIDPAGNLTTYVYDDEWRVVGSTDPEGRSRSIVYPQGSDSIRTTAFTEKDGSTRLYSYDVQTGDPVSKTDPDGNTSSYSYDADHNLTAKTEPGVGTTTYGYDAKGNMLTVTDAAGNTTAFTYNVFSQITSVTDASGATTRYEYDEKGNVTKVTTPDGNSTIYGYDAQGRLTAVTTATGETTALAYDAQGNVASVTGPDGKTTVFAYDANGRRTASTDADGNVTRFEYNANGQLIKVIDARGNATNYEYDANGNRTRVVDANGHATIFNYNFARQLTSMTDAVGYTTTFAYGVSTGCSSCGGGVDKLTHLADAKGQTTLFKYDPLGRLIKETDPLGHNTEYGYNAAGRVSAKTDPNGNTIHYNYDALGRLTAKSYPDGTQATFSYDAKGNLLTAANDSIVYTFDYDVSDRVTSVADSFGHALSYSYDESGRRTNMTSIDGTVIDYVYDDAGRLGRIVSPAGHFTFGYDDLGRRSQLAFPNGVTTSYVYDALGRLTDMVSGKGATVLAENHYTHDAVGNRLSNRDPRSTMSYGYDATYRLKEALSNAPGNSGNTKNSGKGNSNATQNQKEFYVYDPVGNRLQSDKLSGATYSAGNELLSVDGVRYVYDANGNRTQRITTSGIITYTWDAENRLSQIALPDGKSVTYAYDPFGRRIAKTVDGTTTRYTYDGEDILFETESGSLGNLYIHGPGIDEPLAVLAKKGPSFYHADGLGSIVALTDSTAKVVQRYEYDSFGNRKDMQNTIKQPYTYTGREYDKETGLYYYRARYYDAMEGRFISKDPIGFAGGDVNLYNYVGGNSVNYVDPSGLYVGGVGIGVTGAAGGNVTTAVAGSGSVVIVNDDDGNWGVAACGSFGIASGTGVVGGIQTSHLWGVDSICDLEGAGPAIGFGAGGGSGPGGAGDISADGLNLITGAGLGGWGGAVNVGGGCKLLYTKKECEKECKE